MQRNVCVLFTIMVAFATTTPDRSAIGCTTVVVSASASTDGRPILWKNRDTSTTRNEVAFLEDGQLRAVAVVDAGKRSSVFMGVNEAGFCIENSLSTDLALREKQSGPKNGSFMKIALQRCRNIADFETLLAETNITGRQTTANYGVIDAEGGAAMFETGPKSFTKFDANDPQVAPSGYIVRSNFATTAKNLPPAPSTEEVLAAATYSGERYIRACRLLEDRDTKLIDVGYVIRTMTRDMADENGNPYPGTVANPAGVLPALINTDSTISRTTTVSAAVFHGVRPGESPECTTMWTLLGDPKFTIAVPCWVTGHPIADPLEDPLGAELGEIARTLRDWSLTSEGDAVLTSGLPGIWEDLWRLEDECLSIVAATREKWTEQGFDAGEAAKLHDDLAARAMSAMEQELAQAKLATLEAVVDGDFDNTVFAAEPKIRVAIYDHSDGSASGPKNLQRILDDAAGFECTRLHPDEIRPTQLSKYDLLIVPGGSGSLQSKKLGEQGRNAVRQFVESGGGYLGICAGAYLASSQYSWSLGLINARVWDRVHWARGTGTVELSITEDGANALQASNDSVRVYYGQGPLLMPDSKPALPAYEVLATYQTEIAKKGAPVGSMTDTHAIIRSQFGRGRVVCVSPHPEKDGGPQWIIESVVRWVAKDRDSVEVSKPLLSNAQ